MPLRRRQAAPPPADQPKAPPSLKQRLAQRQKAQQLRKEFIVFTTVAVLFAVLIGYAIGLFVGVKLGLGATIGVLYTALSFKFPRQALWAFLIYMPFSGSVTYLIGNSPLLQLAKDGFYIPALFGVVQYCRREKLPILIPRKFIAPVTIFVALCLATLLFVNGGQQLSPEAGESPLLMGILGLKVLVGYIPLIVCAYYLLRDRRDLLFLMRLMVVVVLACCGCAFVQYLLLQIGYCPGTQYFQGEALYKASLEARCLFGGALLYTPQLELIRLPGTFVAPWQWGWFLISAAFLTFSTAFNDPKAGWRTAGLMAIASIFVMAVLSGQRIALVLVPLIFGALLVMTGQVADAKRFVPPAFVLGIFFGYTALSNPEIVASRLESLQDRWAASPPTQFVVNQFTWVIEQQAGILGNGLGRATNSARTLGDTQLIEAYYPKLLYEIGPMGMLAFFVMATALVILCFQAYRRVRDRALRRYGASLWALVVFVSYNTYFYPLDVDPVAVYYWFFAGVILRLPDLERQERFTQAETQQPQRHKRFRRKRAGFS
ncbi:hormogonium polysaccharide biosynthesis protein HpsL [Leptolyngbya sp. AN02str]|uniref:hormogonium polysaccharide biosynthesis protein HpsL n=1 Tax=Leptolyngbya sp. AN02str TaxID=3423363 RepID=UPI003D321833